MEIGLKRQGEQLGRSRMAKRCVAVAILTLLLASIGSLILMPGESAETARYCDLRAELDVAASALTDKLLEEPDRSVIVSQLKVWIASNKHTIDRLIVSTPAEIRQDIGVLVHGLFLAAGDELAVLQQDKYLDADIRVRSFERESCHYPL